VNSAIGLLMFPQQEFVESLPEWNLDDLRQRGWPVQNLSTAEKELKIYEPSPRTCATALPTSTLISDQKEERLLGCISGTDQKKGSRPIKFATSALWACANCLKGLRS
jgi:hypothetical protein